MRDMTYPDGYNYSYLLGKHYVDPQYYEEMGDILDPRNKLFGSVRVVYDYFDIHVDVGHTGLAWGMKMESPQLIIGATLWPIVVSTTSGGSPYLYLGVVNNFTNPTITAPLTGGVASNYPWEYSSMDILNKSPVEVGTGDYICLYNGSPTQVLSDGKIGYTLIFSSNF